MWFPLAWLKKVLPVAGVLVLIVSWAAAGEAPNRASSPSVLLITIDTLRTDHLGCYGYTRVETPAIDGLAASGIRFANAYTQVPITLPSHAVILTGTYPMLNGVRDFTSSGLPVNIPTLAEMVRRHGYHTAAFISSYALSSTWGLNRGFEVYDDDLGPGLGRSPELFLVERRGDRTVDRLLAWLNQQANAPFFAWLHLYDPHSPYRPPEPYLSHYSTHPYDGEIAFDDAQVGRVIAKLKAMRLFGAMAIVLLSDHGESLGEHGEDEHGFFIYNATLRVPLIVKLPDAELGNRKVDLVATIVRPVSTVEVAPAIAELCRIPAGETRSFQGRSLLAGLSHPPAQDDTTVYAESYYPRDSFGWHELRGVVNSRFAYIDAPRPELYDLQRDPGELHNLAGTNASVAASLRSRLEEVERRYGSATAPSSPLPDPDTVERLRTLGYVSLQSPMGAQNNAQRADPKDKIETLRRILHASDLRRLGQYPQADELLASLEKSDPDLYVVPFERGENFLAWAKPQQAQPEFRKALALNSTFDQSLLGLGRAQFILGEDKGAAESLQLALRLNPRNFLARVALAKVYWRQNLPAAAEPELARVVRDHAEFPEGQADYAVILAKLGRYGEAMPHFQQALAAQYRDPVFYDYLGISYEQTGEEQKARDAYQQAVALNPAYAAAYLNLALLSKKQNQPQEARQYFEKACRLSAALCNQYGPQFAK